jgi:hypothetical protein
VLSIQASMDKNIVFFVKKMTMTTNYLRRH